MKTKISGGKEEMNNKSDLLNAMYQLNEINPVHKCTIDELCASYINEQLAYCDIKVVNTEFSLFADKFAVYTVRLCDDFQEGFTRYGGSDKTEFIHKYEPCFRVLAKGYAKHLVGILDIDCSMDFVQKSVDIAIDLWKWYM